MWKVRGQMRKVYCSEQWILLRITLSLPLPAPPPKKNRLPELAEMPSDLYGSNCPSTDCYHLPGYFDLKDPLAML